jgi:hypothetical protein
MFIVVMVAGRLPGRRRHLLDQRPHARRSECLEGQRQQQQAHEQRSEDGFHAAILARATAALA